MLAELFGNTWMEGRWVGTSQYSHGTGFINFGGWDPTGRVFTRIGAITKVRGLALLSGSHMITVFVGVGIREGRST